MLTFKFTLMLCMLFSQFYLQTSLIIYLNSFQNFIMHLLVVVVVFCMCYFAILCTNRDKHDYISLLRVPQKVKCSGEHSLLSVQENSSCKLYGSKSRSFQIDFQNFVWTKSDYNQQK